MHADQIIAITPPELGGACEALSIAHLLRLGVGRVHIRKPEATEAELEALLSALPLNYAIAVSSRIISSWSHDGA